MLNKVKLVTSILFVLLVLIFFFWKKKDNLKANPLISAENQAKENSSTSQPDAETKIPKIPLNLSQADRSNISKIQSAFGAKISFWGKVVDENNKPIEGAKVLFSAADKYFGNGSDYFGKSDSQGLFSITGIKGAGLYVRVEKEGYYHINDKSDGSFGYGMPTGQKPPTQESPAVFILRKKGISEPMIKGYMNFGGKKLSRNGSSIEFDLLTGKEVARGKGNIKLTSKIENIPLFGGPQKYDWSIKIEIPGGGLLDRDDEFSFIAPEGGYQTEWNIEMKKDDPNWKIGVSRNVFIKLGNNKYVRAQLRVEGNSDVVLEDGSGYRVTGVYGDFYLNPSGSRNLEYDENIQRAYKNQQYEEMVKAEEAKKASELILRQSTKQPTSQPIPQQKDEKPVSPKKTAPYKDEKTGGTVVPALN